MAQSLEAMPPARATAASQSSPSVSSKAGIAIEQFMADHGITQITLMPATRLGDQCFDESYSLVIGNNRYFGAKIADALEGPAQ